MTSADPGAPFAAGAHCTLPCAFCGRWNRVPAVRAQHRPKCHDCAKPILLDRPFVLAAETFHRVIAESTVPVVVDFHADWCGPSKMMAAVLGIRGIPTLIRFDAG
jgi:thiol-disulfide isomerase/thioredoxin